MRIILIEDEALIAMDLEEAFIEMGVSVAGVAGSVSTALKLAEYAKYDAAILDINIRGGEVFPVAELIRDKGRPMVFFSGHATTGELVERFPGSPLVQKPASALKLLKALKAAA